MLKEYLLGVIENVYKKVFNSKLNITKISNIDNTVANLRGYLSLEL